VDRKHRARHAAEQRRSLLTRSAPAILGAGVGLAAIWFGTFQLPPLVGMGEPLARLIFALKCAATATLLTFFTGLEAISHERLVTDAFDPLLGHETRRLKVNARYVQNTAEQLLLFVPGHLCLALYCTDGAAMRAVVAATQTWIVMRFAFWIGYHRGAEHRVAGLVGAAQSMVILLYVCRRFGFDFGGWFGAALPAVIVAGIEACIILDLGKNPNGQTVQ
jgi:hypothetical protein